VGQKELVLVLNEQVLVIDEQVVVLKGLVVVHVIKRNKINKKI
jgi:hypothetical protein